MKQHLKYGNCKSSCAFLLFLFAIVSSPAIPSTAGEVKPMTSCSIQGDSSSISFKLKPSQGELDLDGNGPAVDILAVTVLVGPGEQPEVRVSCYGEGGYPPGASKGWLSQRYTVNSAKYIGNPKNDKWHGSSWILPVKPEWNTFTVGIDLVNDTGATVSSLTRTFRFFAFVLEMSPSGRLASPIPGYPEVRIPYATTDGDGNVYAALECYTGNSQGRTSKRALARFARDGGNMRLYDVKDDNVIPIAADNAGRLYAYCLNHIVEFNADMDFVKAHAAFSVDYGVNLTGDDLRKGQVLPQGQGGKTREIPFYKDFYPDRFSCGAALYGNDLYYRACGTDTGGKDVFLATTSLIDGQSRKLANVRIYEGPLLGPGNALYVVEDLRENEHPTNGRGYRTEVMKVFGLDGSSQRSIQFSETFTKPWMKGFDGAGYLLGLHWIGSADFQRFGHLTYGRIRTRYPTPGSSAKEQIDVPFQKTAATYDVSSSGLWYHGGAVYILYGDGAIVKCVSKAPGAERDPMRGAGGGRTTKATPSAAGKSKPAPNGGANTPAPVPITPAQGDAEKQPAGAKTTGQDPAGTRPPVSTAQIDSSQDKTGITPVEDNPNADTRPEEPVSPGQAAGTAAATGIIAAIGSLLLTRSMGITLSDIKDALGTISSGTQPVPIQAEPIEHNDGDINSNGEVWSENSGWVNRDIYEKDRATRNLISKLNHTTNADSDPTIQQLGSKWADSAEKLAEMRRTGRYVDLSTKLADNFGTTAEKAWCREFINRHAKAGPGGYEMDPETARQMYLGLKKQMYTSGQIMNSADADFQNDAEAELASKQSRVEAIRDNAARANRVLARLDPTGTGQKILGLQQGIYGAVDGYDRGGLAGAAESGMLAVADNYTQGYASGNYNALKDAYAEQGISDKSLAGRLLESNLATANNKYNVLDHAGKAISATMDGDYGKAFDSTMDALDARDSAKDDYGKAKARLTRPGSDMPRKPPPPALESEPAPDPGNKSLGTMRRESFDKTRVSFENDANMMKKLNEIADMSDPAHQQAELVKLRNSDPSTYNVVQKQLHPETAGKITDINRTLSDKVVERQAQILHEQGLTPEVRLTGKAGGADTDANWTLTDRQTGETLSESATRKAADDALKQASHEILHPLGTDADKMGHKVMNDSPEKFAADPNDLGIRSRDGRLENGTMVFDEHAKTGEHWTDDPKVAATTAPKDRISEAAMTTDASKSLGGVLQTKVDHVKDIAAQKGTVTEADMRDMAREIVKTDQRTFLPMSDKAGVKPSAEHRDLMQKLMLLKDGEISSRELPPLSEISRILSNSAGQLTDAIDKGK